MAHPRFRPRGQAAADQDRPHLERRICAAAADPDASSWRARLAHEAASENARRLGLSRRAFMVSAAGAASTLAACNARQCRRARRRPSRCGRGRGARPGARRGDGRRRRVHLRRPDPLRRADRPLGAPARPAGLWRATLERVFGQASKCTSGSFDCYSAQTLAKEVFLDSDTDVAVVSALWGIPNPTPIDYAAESREIIAAIGGEGARALIHGGVFPNEPGEIEAMDEKAQRYRVDAWKLYPQWGANGRGFFLDRSDEANRFFEKARRARREDGRGAQGRAAAPARI